MSESAMPPREGLTGQGIQTDRRAWVRHACHQHVGYHPSDAPSGIFWPARVQNVSAGGIGFLLNRRVEPGTVLFLTLPGASNTPARSVAARVLHATLVSAHPGLQWLVGCAFVEPLSTEELQALLA